MCAAPWSQEGLEQGEKWSTKETLSQNSGVNSDTDLSDGLMARMALRSLEKSEMPELTWQNVG